jgi:hypothetical protein
MQMKTTQASSIPHKEGQHGIATRVKGSKKDEDGDLRSFRCDNVIGSTPDRSSIHAVFDVVLKAHSVIPQIVGSL